MRSSVLFALMCLAAAVTHGAETKVSELAVPAQRIGPDWVGPTGLVIDDIDSPPSQDKETARIVGEL
jgi:hypothetical protein